MPRRALIATLAGLIILMALVVITGSRYVIDDGNLGPFGSICHQGRHVYCFDPPDATF